MLKEMEVWSPDLELQLLEELAEVEAQAFEEDIEPPMRLASADSERPWVAYWHLPPNGIRARSRTNSRPGRGQ